MTWPVEYWQRIARQFPTDTLTELAVIRLAADDVSRTRHGIRVALRPDLGDDRSASGAQAYWPEEGCRCWSMKSRGDCSHARAVEMFQAAKGVQFADIGADEEF